MIVAFYFIADPLVKVDAFARVLKVLAVARDVEVLFVNH